MSNVLYVVAAVMLNDQHEILLAQRPQGKSLAGLWEFPGGKIDPNEIPSYALARELKEELDIDVNPSQAVPLTFVEYTYSDFVLFMPVYLLTKWKGKVHPQEQQDVEWVGLDRLKDFPVPPADERLIKQLPDLLKLNLSN